LIQEGLLRTYDIEQERFASPLNFNPAIPEYLSAFPEDELFGAHHDTYSTRMTACGHMNPEYEEDELEKALQWAVWAFETDEPVCFVAIYPEWLKATYMNLLSHHNVHVRGCKVPTEHICLPTTRPLVIVVGRRPQVWHRQLAGDGDRNL
jgi:hypothetical protein